MILILLLLSVAHAIEYCAIPNSIDVALVQDNIYYTDAENSQWKNEIFETNEIKSVSSGDFTTCTISNTNRMECDEGPTAIDNIKSVSIGKNIACYLNNNEEVFCWTSTVSPFWIETSVREVHCVDDHVFTITTSNKLKAYETITTDPQVPPITLLESGVLGISAASSGVCARLIGSVVCWGEDLYPHITDAVAGSPFTSGASSVTLYTSFVDDIVITKKYACVLESNEVKCWGFSDFLNLGTTSNPPLLLPFTSRSTIINLDNVLRLYEQDETTCAIQDDGKIKCWGRSLFGCSYYNSICTSLSEWSCTDPQTDGKYIVPSDCTLTGEIVLIDDLTLYGRVEVVSSGPPDLSLTQAECTAYGDSDGYDINSNIKYPFEVINWNNKASGCIVNSRGQVRYNTHVNNHPCGPYYNCVQKPSALVTLTAGSNSRHFHIPAGHTLSLTSLKLTGGAVSGTNGIGGSIYISETGTLYVTNCLFHSNTATISGAIEVYTTATLVAKNTNFTNNVAQEYGGAIHTVWNGNQGYSGSVTLTNVVLSGNTAGTDGGAIYFFSSLVSLTNVHIHDNTAGGTGGGIIVDRGTYELTNVILSDNSAKYGGAISLWTEYPFTTALTLINVHIRDNTASEYGGAMYTNADSNSSSSYSHTLIIRESTFENNHNYHIVQRACADVTIVNTKFDGICGT